MISLSRFFEQIQLAIFNLFNNQKTRSDEELLARYKKSGNQQDLAILFDKHLSLAFGICLKYLKNKDDASDACMELYEKLVKDLQRFDVENFRAWLARTAVNHCLMKLRTIKSSEEKAKEYEVFLSENMESEQEAHLTKKEEETRIELMHCAMQELKEDQRRCIELFYFHKHSYVEVANMLGMEDKDVKSHIQNGKRNLKQIMINQQRQSE